MLELFLCSLVTVFPDQGRHSSLPYGDHPA
jgi:hypothetical protein